MLVILHQREKVYNVHTIKKYGNSLYHCYRTIVAEMWGFEPQHRQGLPTGFRIRTLQPLGYISIFIIGTNRLPKTPKAFSHSRFVSCRTIIYNIPEKIKCALLQIFAQP